MIKKELGFTLIEMLIVLLIISILVLVTVPNITKHFASIDKKGCDALIKMVQGQVEAYRMDVGSFPTNIDILVNEKYLNESQKACPNGKLLDIQSDGKVILKPSGNSSGTTNDPPSNPPNGEGN